MRVKIFNSGSRVSFCEIKIAKASVCLRSISFAVFRPKAKRSHIAFHFSYFQVIRFGFADHEYNWSFICSHS